MYLKLIIYLVCISVIYIYIYVYILFDSYYILSYAYRISVWVQAVELNRPEIDYQKARNRLNVGQILFTTHLHSKRPGRGAWDFINRGGLLIRGGDYGFTLDYGILYYSLLYYMIVYQSYRISMSLSLSIYTYIYILYNIIVY